MNFRAVAALSLLILASLAPAEARVRVLQVANQTDHCVSVEIFVAQDTHSEMFRLPYQKTKTLKPGATDAFSAIKGQLPAMHLVVRGFIQKNPDCSGGTIALTNGEYLSPKAPLQVPTARIVNVGRAIRVVFP